MIDLLKLFLHVIIIIIVVAIKYVLCGGNDMKVWNKPELAELDINATENGYPTRYGEGVVVGYDRHGVYGFYSGEIDHHGDDEPGREPTDTSTDGDVTNLFSA